MSKAPATKAIPVKSVSTNILGAFRPKQSDFHLFRDDALQRLIKDLLEAGNITLEQLKEILAALRSKDPEKIKTAIMALLSAPLCRRNV